MPYPQIQEYQEAIQNPRSCFADLTLRQSLPEMGSIGLPKPRSGTFGTVYKLVRGTETHAVKCFFNKYDDQQKRYACISDCLNQAKLPFTVDFDYLPQGIRVGRFWYPILMMDWLDGVSLDRYVRAHVLNPKLLHELDEQFLDMVASLRQHRIAHGDLQHGNIIVVGGRLKLIDYDGMYVPGLRGFTGHEVGHPNYQHPLRTAAMFDENMDEFSAQVIHLSLIALQQAPTLWQAFQGGNDCLLLRHADFVDPENSEILQDLADSANELVKRTSIALINFARSSPRRSVLPSPSSSVVPGPPRPPPTGFPDWMGGEGLARLPVGAESKRLLPVSLALPLPQQRPSAPWKRLDAADWLIAQYPPLQDVKFTSPAPRSRSAFLLTLFVAAAAAVLYAMSLVPVLASIFVISAATAILVVVVREEYAHSLELLELVGLQDHATVVQGKRDLLQEQLVELRREYNELVAEEKATIDLIVKKYRDVVESEQSRMAAVLKQLDDQRDSIGKQWSRMWPGASMFGPAVPTTLQLDDSEIGEANIPGIGPDTKQRLQDHGIVTAGDIVDIHIDQPPAVSGATGLNMWFNGTSVAGGADVWFDTTSRSGCHVPGIGPEKAKVLKEWWLTQVKYVESRTVAREAFARSDGGILQKIYAQLTESAQVFDVSHRKYVEYIGVEQRATAIRIEAIEGRKAVVEADAVDVNRQVLETARQVAARSGIRVGQFVSHVFFGRR